jgi:hypothetical protein
VVGLGGPLTQWHRHDNLCFGPATRSTGHRSVTPTPERCPAGQSIALDSPMLHAWVVLQHCGPFAPLEGEGANSAVAEASDPAVPAECAGGA